jgi:hypothetical protein
MGYQNGKSLCESQQEEFIFYKNLLCEVSLYFDRMFNGRFEEATIGKCCFEENESIDAFEMFTSFFYT